MQNVAQTASNVTREILPSSFRSSRAVQNSLNDLALRVFSKGDISNTSARTLLRILSTIGHAERGEVAYRSRLQIAQGLRLQGSNESKRRSVSKLLRKLADEQRKAGRWMVEIIPGVKNESTPGFVDHLGPLVEEADALRRRHRDWKAREREEKEELRDRRIEVTEKAVTWVFAKLPKAEPLPECEASSPLTAGEYLDRSLADFERFVEARAGKLEYDYNSEANTRQFFRQGIRKFERIYRSWEKTLPARRPLSEPFDSAPSEPLSDTSPEMAPLPPALYQSGANFGDLPDFPPEDFDPDLEKSSEGGLGAKMPLGATANSFRFDTISEHSTEHDPPNFEKPWEAEGDARSTASAPEPEALSAGLEAPISDPERSPEPEAPRPCRAELEYHALDNFETLRALTGRLDGLLLLNDRERRMVGEYETPTPERAREQLLRMLERSERERLSLVARWWKQGQRPLILHIDDADLETVRRAEREGLSNVITRTSPGSHHIWIRLSDDLTDAEFLTIRRRLFLKLNPSMDPHAPNNSGSYGSARLGRNWKRGGCLIEVISFDLERSASVAALESGGWLAPLPEPSKPVTAAYRRHAGDSVGSWEPDFKLCLKARGGDRFRAGYLFTRLGMTQKGWSADEAATRLEAADPKATHRRGYVSDTVDRVSSDIAGRELEAKS